MLENMRSFARVVETGSFSEAARRMRVSANVMSHRIQTLETHLGCRLFNRTTRRMALTEQGRVYYDRVIEALQILDEAGENIGELGKLPRGVIRVAAPLGLGRRLVAPVAARFQESHPQIDVQLRLTERRIDPVGEDIDLVLQFAELSDPGMIMRKIGEAPRLLCAAPSYLARCGAPRSIADLARHNCLLLRFPGSQEFRWTLQRDGAEVNVPVSGRLDADDGDVLTGWALEGCGIVMKPAYEVAAYLADGRLLPVLPAHPPPPGTLAVLMPERRLVPLKVRAFADLLVEHGRRFLAGEAVEGGQGAAPEGMDQAEAV
jgi:DNA-binding transcriptional LysR family regulator